MKTKVRTQDSRCEVRTVSLPRSTWDSVDAATTHGGRSEFIDKAIRAALTKHASLDNITPPTNLQP